MRVVAFNGSPRKEGNTYHLLREVLGELETKDIETQIVQVGGELIRGCTACGTCRTKQVSKCKFDDDVINMCIKKMIDADGILLGSPTYFSDLTPELKALIDRAGYVARGNDHLFKRKVGAAVVAVRRAGSIHTLDSINHFFAISQMIIPGSTYWNIGFGKDKGDVTNDDEGMDTMRNLGRNMAWLLGKIHA